MICTNIRYKHTFMVWHKQVCSQSNFAYISQNYPTQQNNYILHETLVTALFQIKTMFPISTGTYMIESLLY